MKTTTILAIIIVLSLIGLADSWYLTESAMTDTPLVCGPGVLEGCNAVAQSPYSKLLGVPLAMYGVLFYALTLILSAAILFLKIRALPLYLLVATAGGAVASVYFLFVQFFLIKALCVYCLLSAGISFALCALSYIIYTRERTPVSTPLP